MYRRFKSNNFIAVHLTDISAVKNFYTNMIEGSVGGQLNSK
jgi:hypothetical protein